MENNDYIAHWGIKGMKWGVRKEEAVTSRERINRNNNDTKLALAKGEHKLQKFLSRQQRREGNRDAKLASVKEENRHTEDLIRQYRQERINRNNNNTRLAIVKEENKRQNDPALALAKEEHKLQKFLSRQQRREGKDNTKAQIRERKDNMKAQKLIEENREKRFKRAGVAIAGTFAAALIVSSMFLRKRKASNSNVVPASHGSSIIPISHSGIIGMRWGVRRYQNEDGTLTEGGKARYRRNSDGTYEKLDARTMTDQELDDSVARFKREAQYNDATGNEHRNPGYKKNLAEKTAVSGLGAFTLAAATSFVANKFGRGDPLKGKDLAKRVLANGVLAGGVASVTAFSSATGKAQNLNPNISSFDTYANKAETAKKKK